MKQQKSVWTELVIDSARGSRTALGFYGHVAFNAYLFIGIWTLLAPVLAGAWVLDLPGRLKRWHKYRRLALGSASALLVLISSCVQRPSARADFVPYRTYQRALSVCYHASGGDENVSCLPEAVRAGRALYFGDCEIRWDLECLGYCRKSINEALAACPTPAVQGRDGCDTHPDIDPCS